MKLSLFLSSWLLQLSVQSVLPCAELENEVPNPTQRSSNYETLPNERRISDHGLVQGWYEAKGFTLSSAENPPEKGACNTFYPVFLKEPFDFDSLANDTKTATVQIGGLTHGSDHHSAEWDIDIRNCEGTIQYFLKPTPIRYAAYCFDPDESENDTSDSVNPSIPTIEHLHIYAELVFENETIEGVLTTVPYIQLRCEAYYYSTGSSNTQYGNIWDDYRMKVLWYADGELIKTTGPFIGQNILNENKLHEREFSQGGHGFGSEIQCSFEISASVSFTNKARMLSSVFFLGWSGYGVFVSHGNSYPQPPYGQTPLGCTSIPGDGRLNCTLKINIVDAMDEDICQDAPANETSHPLCGIEMIGLTQAGWDAFVTDNWHYYSSYNLYIQWYQYDNGTSVHEQKGTHFLTNENNTLSLRDNMYLSLKASEGTGHRFWENKRFPDVSVILGDNFMTNGGATFDETNHFNCYLNGQNVYVSEMYTYDTHDSGIAVSAVGEYILLRLGAIAFEVQIKVKQCENELCICSISVRYREDIFVMDACDSQLLIGLVAGEGKFITPYSLYTSETWSSVSVQVAGLFVTCGFGFYDGRTSISFSSYGSSSGLNVEGGCMGQAGGVYIHRDGSSSTDGEAFLRSWAISQEDSLLSPFDLMDYAYTMSTYYCRCPSESTDIPNSVIHSESDSYHNIYTYTGAILCATDGARVCTHTHDGTVWPETLLPDYMIGELKVVAASHTAEPFFQLLCVFNAKEALIYDVNWYVNDVMVHDVTGISAAEIDLGAFTSTQILSLIQDTGNFCLADAISCEVTVIAATGEVLISAVRSPNFYSMQLSTTTIDMHRGSEVVLGVILNIPFICALSDGTLCELEIRIYDPDETYTCSNLAIGVKGRRGCGAQVPSRPLTFNTGTPFSGDTASVTLTTKHDETYNLRKKFRLKARTVVKGLLNSLWNCELPEIQVNVVDFVQGNGKSCKAHVDPHMSTADGRRYEMQYVGIWILMRFLDNTSKPIEVQIRTDVCNRYATCVCAVAIRAGGDVFVIDHCDNQHTTRFYSETDKIVKPYTLDGMRYQVVLPGTSTMVEVNSFPFWGYWLNVDIWMSPSDMYKIEGLCGTFNGNRNDDFLGRDGVTYTPNNMWDPYNFSMSWRISDSAYESEILFDPQIQPSQWNDDQQVCVCPNENMVLSDFDYLCSANEDQTCVIPKSRKGKAFQNRARDKRSSSLRPPPGLVTHPRFKRSTETDMTETEARDICQRKFLLTCPVYNTSLDIKYIYGVDTDVDGLIEDCTKDVKWTNEPDWATVHCNALISAVQREMQANSSFAEEHEEIVQGVNTVSCMDNCYYPDHGTCVDGKCECKEEFIGYNCAVSSGTPPEMVTVDAECDTASSDCSCIYIAGERYIENQTECQFSVAEVDKSGELTHQYVVRGFAQVGEWTYAYCCIPGSRKRRSTSSTSIATVYTLSVSNNGVNFGAGQTIYVLDTTCQQTANGSDGSTIVVLKSGYCFISGVCVSETSTNPNEPCEVCDPSGSAFTWSTSGCSTGAGNQSISGLHVGYIALIAVASSVLLILTIVMVVLKCKKIRPVPQFVEPEPDLVTPRNVRFNFNKAHYAWMDYKHTRAPEDPRLDRNNKPK